MTVTIARPRTPTHGPLYWKGGQAHQQADVTLMPREAKTWPDECEARSAVEAVAPWLWRMGYRVERVEW